MSTPAAPTTTTSVPATGIDPRGPRFGAGITAVLLLVTIALELGGATLAGTILFAAIVAVFAWGAFAGIRRHPYGVLFKRVVRPRLAPPSELEDPAPPTFAQGVGFVITIVGLALGLALQAPTAIVVAAALAFVAAFLNSVFAFCLGCQIYLLLARTGLIRRNGATTA
ncbi:DUF4395 domain-containing protein [Galbitalea sp. SE-J8]|uniref:DUF4395 domain-containing protein n=1 Tax=Galbitalea sp. SE-J8 TaxID=3054952 RepID=UPI00259CCE81|nr:DUF4395 domain-containing protein [Galbitalea sp. SE-J8]MDM4762569.1 DUF4395 domain-containing protein [Galbitalea sp. SE-J8]